MAETKTIAVTGATGSQGSGLVNAILEDAGGPFDVRALTRSPDSDAARALRDRGAEVVEADLNDPASVRTAFRGAYGAYCVTFFWEHFSPQKELEHARTLADAAREAGLGHVVWSTLEDTRERIPVDEERMPTLMGDYNVPHFDAKGEANAFFREAGVPTTFYHTSFYWDNLIHFGMEPQRQADGSLVFVLPMGESRLPGIAAADIGRCAHGIFRAGDEFVGETVGVAGEHLTGAEMAAALTEALGETVVHHDMPLDDYRALDFPGADDLGNMFQFKREFEDEYCGLRDVELSRRLNPELQTFPEWLARNAGRLPVDRED